MTSPGSSRPAPARPHPRHDQARRLLLPAAAVGLLALAAGCSSGGDSAHPVDPYHLGPQPSAQQIKAEHAPGTWTRTNDTTVSFAGTIAPGAAQAFTAALTPKTTTVTIASPGGDTREALAIAQTIHDRGLTLDVRDACIGPCADYLFAAAPVHRMEPGSWLGFTPDAAYATAPDTGPQGPSGAPSGGPSSGPSTAPSAPVPSPPPPAPSGPPPGLDSSTPLPAPVAATANGGTAAGNANSPDLIGQETSLYAASGVNGNALRSGLRAALTAPTALPDGTVVSVWMPTRDDLAKLGFTHLDQVRTPANLAAANSYAQEWGVVARFENTVVGLPATPAPPGAPATPAANVGAAARVHA